MYVPGLSFMKPLYGMLLSINEFLNFTDITIGNQNFLDENFIHSQSWCDRFSVNSDFYFHSPGFSR